MRAHVFKIILVLLLPRHELISNVDHLTSLLTFLLSFFLNEMFGTVLFQWHVASCLRAWQEYADHLLCCSVCSELREIAAFINASVICELASALEGSVPVIAIRS